MTNSRACDDQGMLVDGDARLPADLCEYYRKAVGALVGCNRLRCARCGEWVRSGPPGVGLKEDAAVDVTALFSTEDWLSLPFIEQRKPALSISRKVRLYSCKCRCWEAERVDRIDNEHDSPSDPEVPWSCAGHQVPELPAKLSELTIAANSNCAELVAEILGGACPRPLELATEHVEEGPSSWLSWLYSYLAGLPIAEQLSLAIGARIDDSDPAVVGRVLQFFCRFPHANGVERLVDKAEKAPDQVAVGYVIQESESALTLWDVLIALLEQRRGEPLDRRVDTLIRKVLLVPLASLSHEEPGPTSVSEFKRQSMARFGWDITSVAAKQRLDRFAEYRKSERVDVIVSALNHFSTAFNDDELRLFIADHIVELDAAAAGRWRAYMNMLSDWYHKPELGHLIVVAGMRLIESRAVSVDEFRDWMKQRSPHGWIDDAWVLPLETVLDKKPPVN